MVMVAIVVVVMGGVVGGGGDRGCGDLVVVGIVVIWGAKLVVVIWLLRYGWSKITIEKEKPTSKGHSPVNTKKSL